MVILACCQDWLQDVARSLLPLTFQDWPELTGPDGNDALEREMAAREVELRVLRKAVMAVEICRDFYMCFY